MLAAEHSEPQTVAQVFMNLELEAQTGDFGTERPPSLCSFGLLFLGQEKAPADPTKPNPPEAAELARRLAVGLGSCKLQADAAIQLAGKTYSRTCSHSAP